MQPRIGLPTSFKGAGFKGLVGSRAADYTGGVTQGISALIDRSDDHGSTRRGICHLPQVVDHIGDGVFDKGNVTPWLKILGHGNSRICQGIRDACQDIIETKVVTGQDLEKEKAFTNQTKQRAGFDIKGGSTDSATNAITNKLNQATYQRELVACNHLPGDDYIRAHV